MTIPLPTRASHTTLFVIPSAFASPINTIFGSPDYLNSPDDFTGALSEQAEKRPLLSSVSKGKEDMRILLFNPDNGVTRNFMPHLWMFLLKALTPPEHEVLLIDGNAQPMTENEIAHFVRAHNIRLVGISAMTRMAARAYKMADAIRATGAKVVFG